MAEAQAQVKSGGIKPKTVILVVLVAGLVAFAAWAVSRPAPGQKTTTDTSVAVVISDASPNDSVEVPIRLQEGGDPAHEVDHVIDPLKVLPGVAKATLQYSPLVLVVDFDNQQTDALTIKYAMGESGYGPPVTGGAEGTATP